MMRSAMPIAVRLLTTLPVLLGVSLLTFLISSVLPGSTAQVLLGVDATPEQVAQAMRRHIDPSKLTIIKAGDFAKKPAAQ